MRVSGDDTPRETPVAKGSDSRISTRPESLESPRPPTTSSNPPSWRDEPTKRDLRFDHVSQTRAEGRAHAVRVRVNAVVAAVAVFSVLALMVVTLLAVFVFAMGMGAALMAGFVAAVAVGVAGRMFVQRVRSRR